MTTAQEKSIARIKKLAETMHGHHSDKYEIKRFDVREYEYFVAVVVEIGHIGDEGTLGEIFCRDTAHLFVGKRGGITYPYTSRTGKDYRLQFHHMIGVIVDQRRSDENITKKYSK